MHKRSEFDTAKEANTLPGNVIASLPDANAVNVRVLEHGDSNSEDVGITFSPFADDGGKTTSISLTEADDEDEDLPSDFMPPKPTQEKRLSIQMGAVMVSFDMDGFQQEEVDEQELLSGYKTPTYPGSESPAVEHQSPEHGARRLQKKHSRDEMQTLLKEHRDIVNILKEQERHLSLSDSEHSDNNAAPTSTSTSAPSPKTSADPPANNTASTNNNTAASTNTTAGTNTISVITTTCSGIATKPTECSSESKDLVRDFSAVSVSSSNDI